MMESVDLYLWGVITVDKEEEDLKIEKNHDLNEEAEYAGNKQDLEQMLLDAQRYLNIFHQIHIFKERKKAEFEQSLIEMPERLRAILLNLPGGRVLLEYIEDCEIKRGLRSQRTIFGSENPIVKLEKEQENKSAVNKEFTQAITNTIADTMAEYNQNLLQMNERILNNSKQIAGKSTSDNQAKILADALRENNQQQMEMMKTFGSTLSQAILMSQKEMFASIPKPVETNPIFNDSVKKSSVAAKIENKDETTIVKATRHYEEKKPENQAKLIVENNNKNNTQTNDNKLKDKPAENTAKPDNTPKPDILPIKADTTEAKAEVKQEQKQEVKIANKTEIKPEIKTGQPDKEIKQSEKHDDFDDIDIASLLTAIDGPAEKEADKKDSKKKEPEKKDADRKDTEKKESEKKGSDKKDDAEKESENTASKISPFSLAMQKIKNAITEPADISLDSLDVKPVSLGNGDNMTLSMTEAFKDDKKDTSLPPAFDHKLSDDEEWEYVDEDGNPIDPSEWEYVDENGNPIDPSEWEYVDENGNPVDSNEWEYVDENGNPIEK